MLLALVLISCGDASRGRSANDIGNQPPGTPLPDGTSANDPADSALASEPTPAEWMTAPTRRDQPVPGVALLGDVRTARNEGFDRVVFEFEGDTLPSYRIEYVDRPIRQCGSGNPVDAEGAAWITVLFDPAAAHDEQGQPTITERSLRPGLPALRELTLICDFEAQVEWVLGLSAPNRYRAMELLDPARLLVDVRH